jgi:type II secretory ATPase GspE/PulE/Tfp pilus assembly ATPase PilB-like protein
MSERLYSASQIAGLLGTSPGSVVEWMQRGWLPFLRFPDGQVRVSRDVLMHFLQRRGVEAEAVLLKANGTDIGEECSDGFPPAVESPEPGEPTGDQTSADYVSDGPADEDRYEPNEYQFVGRPGVQLDDPQPEEPDEFEDIEDVEQELDPGLASRTSQPAHLPALEAAILQARTNGHPDPLDAKTPFHSRDEHQTARQVCQEIVRDAVARGASAVHLFPVEEGFSLRLRVDGVLHEKPRFTSILPDGLGPQLIETFGRLSCSGRSCDSGCSFHLDIDDRAVRFEMTTLNTVRGPAAVLAIDDPAGGRKDLSELGMSESDRQAVARGLAIGRGLILVASPEPRTRHRLLEALSNGPADSARSVLVVTSSAELRVDHGAVVRVGPATDSAYADALATAMAADADLAVVDDLRDPSSARAAVELALGGTCVLAGVDAPDAAHAITDLLAMDVPPWPLSRAIQLVLAGRLPRRLCAKCRLPRRPDASLAGELGVAEGQLPDTVYGSVGCPVCHSSGYAGVAGLLSVMEMSPGLLRAIRQGYDASVISAAAQYDGMTPLRKAGLRALRWGLTSPDELRRSCPDLFAPR